MPCSFCGLWIVTEPIEHCTRWLAHKPEDITYNADGDPFLTLGSRTVKLHYWLENDGPNGKHLIVLECISCEMKEQSRMERLSEALLTAADIAGAFQGDGVASHSCCM